MTLEEIVAQVTEWAENEKAEMLAHQHRTRSAFAQARYSSYRRVLRLIEGAES